MEARAHGCLDMAALIAYPRYHRPYIASLESESTVTRVGAHPSTSHRHPTFSYHRDNVAWLLGFLSPYPKAVGPAFIEFRKTLGTSQIVLDMCIFRLAYEDKG